MSARRGPSLGGILLLAALGQRRGLQEGACGQDGEGPFPPLQDIPDFSDTPIGCCPKCPRTLSHGHLAKCPDLSEMS